MKTHVLTENKEILELNPRGRWRHRCTLTTATPPIRLRGKLAPQSPLEESATTEASRMWHENERVRCRYCSKNPFFECSFHEFCPKSGTQTVGLTPTLANTQTDRIQPIPSSSEDVFWTVKTQIPVAKASKTCPQIDFWIPLTSQLKDALRFGYCAGVTPLGVAPQT